MFSFRKSEKFFNWIDEEYPCITDAFYFSLTYQSSQEDQESQNCDMVLTAPVRCLFLHDLTSRQLKISYGGFKPLEIYFLGPKCFFKNTPLF